MVDFDRFARSLWYMHIPYDIAQVWSSSTSITEHMCLWVVTQFFMHLIQHLLIYFCQINFTLSTFSWKLMVTVAPNHWKWTELHSNHLLHTIKSCYLCLPWDTTCCCWRRKTIIHLRCKSQRLRLPRQQIKLKLHLLSSKTVQPCLLCTLSLTKVTTAPSHVEA